MSTDKIWEALIQLPYVLIFMAFFLRYTKVWRDYLKERNGRLEKTLREMHDTMRSLSERLKS